MGSYQVDDLIVTTGEKIAASFMESLRGNVNKHVGTARKEVTPYDTEQIPRMALSGENT